VIEDREHSASTAQQSLSASSLHLFPLRWCTLQYSNQLALVPPLPSRCCERVRSKTPFSMMGRVLSRQTSYSLHRYAYRVWGNIVFYHASALIQPEAVYSDSLYLLYSTLHPSAAAVTYHREREGIASYRVFLLYSTLLFSDLFMSGCESLRSVPLPPETSKGAETFSYSTPSLSFPSAVSQDS
jgi:hypothetical protein